MTFTEAVGGDVSGKVVAITFDDGYRSVFELAQPILKRFGMPGTVFVPTDFLGREQPMQWPGIDHWSGGEHQHELMPMSWEQARELIDQGWEIGSHTKSHPRLTEISDEALESELRESRLECEHKLGVECRSLAFPYGNHDARVVAAAETAGYSSLAALSEDNPVSLARPTAADRHLPRRRQQGIPAEDIPARSQGAREHHLGAAGADLPASHRPQDRVARVSRRRPRAVARRPARPGAREGIRGRRTARRPRTSAAARGPHAGLGSR